MSSSNTHARLESGYMLVEVLVSILIFSVGVLAIVSLQAASIKNVTDAKYRTDASLLANQLIGQMWADDRTPATLQTNYQGGQSGVTDGAKYTTWLADVQQLPGVAASGGVSAHPPQVIVTTLAGSNPPSTSKSRVQITIYWLPTGEDAVHRYDVVTEIK